MPDDNSRGTDADSRESQHCTPADCRCSSCDDRCVVVVTDKALAATTTAEHRPRCPLTTTAAAAAARCIDRTAASSAPPSRRAGRRCRDDSSRVYVTPSTQPDRASASQDKRRSVDLHRWTELSLRDRATDTFHCSVGGFTSERAIACRGAARPRRARRQQSCGFDDCIEQRRECRRLSCICWRPTSPRPRALCPAMRYDTKNPQLISCWLELE